MQSYTDNLWETQLLHHKTEQQATQQPRHTGDEMPYNCQAQPDTIHAYTKKARQHIVKSGSIEFSGPSGCHRIALQHAVLQQLSCQQCYTTVVREYMSFVPEWCTAEEGSGMHTASALLKHHHKHQ